MTTALAIRPIAQPFKEHTMHESPAELAVEVARIKAEISATLDAIDGTSPAERVAACERALDDAVAANDVARIKSAAAALSSARAGTDEASTARSIAESKLRGLRATLAAAERALHAAEREVLIARKARLHEATVKAFREYADLVDEVVSAHLRLALTGQEYNRVEALVRGAPQVNHLPVPSFIAIPEPGGYVPCITDADRKKRFGREIAMYQPPPVVGVGARPWPGQVLVQKLRSEVEGI